MTIQTRLAKLEGINNARSDKLEKARAYALKLFGVDDPAILKPLLERVQALESQLHEAVSKAEALNEHCVGKLENRQRLTQKELDDVEAIKSQIAALQSQIQTEIADCRNKGRAQGVAEAAPESPAVIEAPSSHGFSESAVDNPLVL